MDHWCGGAESIKRVDEITFLIIGLIRLLHGIIDGKCHLLVTHSKCEISILYINQHSPWLKMVDQEVVEYSCLPACRASQNLKER